MTLPETTRFGSTWWPPERATAVLRAKAASCELTLRDTTLVDRVAAIIGADGWMLATGASSFAGPAQHGPEAVSALARVLRRAAGWGASPEREIPSPAQLPPDLCTATELYRSFADLALGTMAPAALKAAAEDLAIRSGRLAILAGLLATSAETAMADS